MKKKYVKLPQYECLYTYFFLFSAPEIQHKSECSSASDMFSLGMLMISAFNGGQSIIQANHSTNLYFKQAGLVRVLGTYFLTLKS